MIQNLSIKIADLEKDKESSSSRKTFKPFFKKRDESGSPQPPTQSSFVLNFTEVGMENFCTFHQEPYSKKIFPWWINSMTLVMNQILDTQINKPEVKEERENESEEPIETKMVLWDS